MFSKASLMRWNKLCGDIMFSILPQGGTRFYRVTARSAATWEAASLAGVVLCRRYDKERYFRISFGLSTHSAPACKKPPEACASGG